MGCRGACSSAEAACLLNNCIWEVLGVRYEPGMTPQSLAPLEVVSSGKASCSGLSLLLVAACRSVGVPSRVVGVAEWPDKSGNHAWVEVYSEGSWSFLGAAEPGPLNSTWFHPWLSGDPRCTVYASTWHRVLPRWHPKRLLWWRAEIDAEQRPRCYFPVVWDPSDLSVPAVDVSAVYQAGT